MIQALGTVSTLFGVALLVLPAVRVGQRRLAPRRALGLWGSGFGFLLMGRAAFLAGEPAAEGLVVAGALLAILGNIFQRFVSGSSL